MRLLYLANNRIPSEKANSLQIMQTCAALARQGVDLTLVVPHRLQPRPMRGIRDPFDYYGLKTRFPIHRLPCVDFLELAPRALQPPAFALQAISFALAAVPYINTKKVDTCYTRDPLSAVLLAMAPGKTRRKAVYEAHTFPGRGWKRQIHLWAVRRLTAVTCITRELANEYLAGGVDPKRIIIAPDAVDLERFTDLPEKREVRRRLGIPLDLRVVCYTGHLYAWKGADTLARAARYLPDDYLVYVVGGTKDDLLRYRKLVQEEGLDRVRVVGHVPPDQVPEYLAAADVLVLPNSGRSETSARFTSPMKLFEYMAAGRPIVASCLPSIQEVLRDHENAVLVEPDNPEALARGIMTVIVDAALGTQLAAKARSDVQAYSWDTRAHAILRAVREFPTTEGTESIEQTP